jgi:hypothetical protein
MANRNETRSIKRAQAAALEEAIECRDFSKLELTFNAKMGGKRIAANKLIYKHCRDQANFFRRDGLVGARIVFAWAGGHGPKQIVSWFENSGLVLEGPFHIFTYPDNGSNFSYIFFASNADAVHFRFVASGVFNFGS